MKILYINNMVYHEDRPWGFFENIIDESGYKVKKILVYPGNRLSLQSHNKRSEHWTVVKGLATVQIADKTEDIPFNGSCYIPCGEKHRLQNKTGDDIIVIEVQCGDYLGEDDIVRYEDDYNR